MLVYKQMSKRVKGRQILRYCFGLFSFGMHVILFILFIYTLFNKEVYTFR